MLSILVALGVIYWIGARFGDHAGAIAVLVAAGLFVVALCKAARDDRKAYANWVRYWANGGPDRRR